jgi:hypothetical protein
MLNNDREGYIGQDTAFKSHFVPGLQALRPEQRYNMKSLTVDIHLG